MRGSAVPPIISSVFSSVVSDSVVPSVFSSELSVSVPSSVPIVIVVIVISSLVSDVVDAAHLLLIEDGGMAKEGEGGKRTGALKWYIESRRIVIKMIMGVRSRWKINDEESQKKDKWRA